MNLVDKDMKAFLSGALRVERTDTGLLPHRMTPAQLACTDTMERYVARARSAAGVQIAFVTDSPTVTLRMYLPATDSIKYRQAAVDVECEGAVTQVAVSTGERREAFFDKRLLDGGDGRMRSVRLFIPYHRPVHLQALEVEDGARVKAVPRPARRLLTIGDSITQGAYATSSYPTYAVQLARLLGMELLNHGLGGHRFEEGILDDELDYEPDLVTVAYGTNDWNTSTAGELRAREDAFVKKLRGMFARDRTRVVVVSPLWRTDAADEHPGGTLRAFCDTLMETAAATGGVEVIDGWRLMPHRAGMFTDGVHPNDTSMPLYAINLYRELRGNASTDNKVA